MADPVDVGARVLANLEAGRARGIAAAKKSAMPLQAAVLDEWRRDVLGEYPARGRPARIYRQLKRRGIAASERHVRRIVSGLLVSMSETPP